MRTPILGASYVARSVNAADNRMVNLFPEYIPEGGKDAAYLSRAPGLSLFASVGNGPIRGMWQTGLYGYVVSSNTLYQIDKTGKSVQLGFVDGSGPVSMSDNGIQIFVACNPSGFVYNTSTNKFTQITDPNFHGAGTVAFLNGYFVFNQPNSQTIWHSALFDGLEISEDFQSAEGSPDNLVGLVAAHKELWLFGSDSVEVWYNSGGSVETPENIFAPIPGAYSQIGCAATFSIARLDNSLFWLGRDNAGSGIVYSATGYNPQRISTHAIEWQIQSYPRMDDAIAYSYQQDGHPFYVLTFPTASKTWVYDVSTRSWHERASFDGGLFYRHRSNCQMVLNNQILVGDYGNGNIYTFDLDTYSDNNKPQKWLRSWRALPPGENSLKRSSHHTLQLDAQAGHTLPSPVDGLETESLLWITTESGVEIVVDVSIDRIYVDNFLLNTKSSDYLLTEDSVLLGGSEEKEFILEPGSFDLGVLQGEDILTNNDQEIFVGYVPEPRKPEFMLRWSDDGGHNWSNEMWAGGGNAGQYGTRIIWRRLGMTLRLRDRVYEVSGTDPIKIAIMGAELYATPTRS
jgi:hypothetical protein